VGYNSVADRRGLSIRLAVVAFQMYEIVRNSTKIRTYGSPGSSTLVSIDSPCTTSY